MAHQYSVEIQNQLGAWINEAQEKLRQLPADDPAQAYWQGRLEEANLIRRHLTQNYDLKTQTYF